MKKEAPLPQRWACARSRRWRVGKNYWGETVFVSRLVYCNAEKFQYAMNGQPGWCKVHERHTTYVSCLACPLNEGTHVMECPRLPDVVTRVRLRVVR